jgi:hypothetical protein
MDINWNWSLETETNRILQASLNTANGFYSLNHFYPLPWSEDTKYQPAGVYLPVLPFSTIPHYWDRARRLDDLHLPLLAPDDLTHDLTNLLLPLNLQQPDSRLYNQIQLTLPTVVSWLKKFTRSLYLPDTVTIYPTYFGTVGTFYQQ